MFKKLFGSGKKQVEVLAPMTGRLAPLADVPDEAFAQGLMGPGAAIEPSEGVAVAPFDGTVAHLIDTHHAVIVEHESGLQLLIHIGINTVAMKGAGFKALVQTGDAVKAGQPLIEFDLEAIRAAGHPAISPVIVAEEDAAEKVDITPGAVRAGEAGKYAVTLKQA
ncbi:PTS glucose transporter subunit IIA [Paenibacillus albicereus]|uniref:PTS glucose transporter subunit IIA n=1 Tax=Paenibacillus albicereus TaxID=2726185 RepID=A0A6H2H2G3_9BACL|nr:PTS glucose transporter subunit IIA [Paenibacillus albicereus]QJC53893.1 PTS glucose transporter subunit IIA [Paenibacillus albicereus]